MGLNKTEERHRYSVGSMAMAMAPWKANTKGTVLQKTEKN